MADEGLLVEEGDGEEVCLELIDLLLQGLPLLLGWGMAVEEDDDDDDDDKDDEGIRAEVAAGMLVEELTVTADDGACSVINEGCEVTPSEESLFRCELALVLSLKPWLRLFPAALTEPLGVMSLPAVDILAVGPGSLEVFF